MFTILLAHTTLSHLYCLLVIAILAAGFGLLLCLHLKTRKKYIELLSRPPRAGNKKICPEQNKPSTEGHERILMDRITDLLLREECYRDPDLTLVRLADMLQVNRSDLSRTINIVTGKHFNRWLNEIRIRESLPALARKDRKYTVTAIAYEVGFQDRTTFFRAFKSIYGIPPTEFYKMSSPPDTGKSPANTKKDPLSG